MFGKASLLLLETMKIFPVSFFSSFDINSFFCLHFELHVSREEKYVQPGIRAQTSKGLHQKVSFVKHSVFFRRLLRHLKIKTKKNAQQYAFFENFTFLPSIR